MKIFVCWENSGEKKTAGRMADMVRNFINHTHRFPQIDVLTSHVTDGHFGPYRNDAEALAAEAQRLLEAQEAAFGITQKDLSEYMATQQNTVKQMAAQTRTPPAIIAGRRAPGGGGGIPGIPGGYTAQPIPAPYNVSFYGVVTDSY
jgi:hypothetical protein